MTDFKRGERYLVIKRSHLTENDEAVLRNFLCDLNVRTIGCVVVEKDWPEYNVVWNMIEERTKKESV